MLVPAAHCICGICAAGITFSSLNLGAGPCAAEPCEPRQVRKEATVSNQFWVPQDHLAPLIREAEKDRRLRSRIAQSLNVPTAYALAFRSLRPRWSVFLSLP